MAECTEADPRPERPATHHAGWQRGAMHDAREPQPAQRVPAAASAIGPSAIGPSAIGQATTEDTAGKHVDTRLVLARGSGHDMAQVHHAGSGMQRGIAAADGLAVLPPGDAPAGSAVRWLPLPGTAAGSLKQLRNERGAWPRCR